MKRLRASGLVVFLICTHLLYADIALVKTAGVVAFDEARNGFASTCFESRQEFDLLEDLSNQDEVINGIKSGSFRLLVGIGTQAAMLVKNNFPQTPIVFTMVVDPARIGLSGNNVTGVALNVPVREEFLILKSIDKKAKRIGMVYTQGTNDGLLNEARTVAAENNLTIVAGPINARTQLQQVLTDLLGKCDALWVPPDATLNSEEVVRYIGSTSLSRQIPFVGPSDRYVRSGAIFSLAPDTVEAGKMAADMANQILQGAAPSSLAVQILEKPKVIINLKAADLLGLTIPKNVQNSASKIYQ